MSYYEQLFAKIYYTKGQVLAKAHALNYTMESFMDTKKGKGKMVVISNDNSNGAAITFSATSMKEVWEKENVDAEKYEMKLMPDREKVAGYLCNKLIYTPKESTRSATSLSGKKAYKVIVWYSSEVSQDINFLHPFYFQLDKGILKIEVHYDKTGKFKMLYEVSGMESKSLSGNDFIVSDAYPFVDWDTNQMKASMNMLNVMMSRNDK